jgi:energy-coupling factor transport system ATP-binding protein
MRIELDGIRFRHGKKRRWAANGAADPYVLDGIGFAIEPGEQVAICGKSGSGKTTLLHLIKGFMRPTEGLLKLDGIDPYQARTPEMFDRIGYVFQYPEHQMFAPTVAEDIGFGIRHSGLTPKEREAKIRQAMDAVGLQETAFATRSPLELSGGEKRRAAIAGVLVLEPEILVLDEPTAGLDLPSRRALFELLHDLNDQLGTTVIWVSHQLEEILEHSSRMLALHQGVIVADGAPMDRIADPSLRALFGWEEPPALALARWFREHHGIEIRQPWNTELVAQAYQTVLERDPLWLQAAT